MARQAGRAIIGRQSFLSMIINPSGLLHRPRIGCPSPAISQYQPPDAG
jgi:hypothetical protein